MGNLTQTERSRSFGALHQSESQGTYLQELENERIRRAQRIRKIHIKEYDIRLYEHAVRKDENLKAREEAIKQRGVIIVEGGRSSEAGTGTEVERRRNTKARGRAT
jgi:hypothetical protein